MAINSSGRRAKVLLDTVFRAAISSAMPAESVIASLPEKPTGRCVVVGAGKAAAAMAAAVDTAWQDVDLSGIVSTRYEHAVPAGRVEVIEAGHPVPDRNSEVAAMRMLEKVRNLTADDLVLALFSGGGSATLALAVEPLTLEAKQNITSQLLKSGASITEMNVIRTHLSRIKGGRLARILHQNT